MRTFLRKVLPVSVKNWLKRLLQTRPLPPTPSLPPVIQRSRMTNIYHCCVQKTASRWVMKLLNDPRTFAYSGLATYTYEQDGQVDERRLDERLFDTPFPVDSFCSPLYISFESFQSIPKPEQYRAFFVMRDPRDIVVSWYFSARYSHGPVGPLSEIRQRLEAMSQDEGLVYGIDYLESTGLFKSLASWTSAETLDPNVMLVKFEEATGADNVAVFTPLFAFCDIHMPAPTLKALLQDYSFEHISGRERGSEDVHSHYRKGISGDWKNYFTEAVTRHFEQTTGTLVQDLGYR